MGSETRPNTAASALTDPFSTPVSSRSPSIRHQPASPSSSKVSFPDSWGGVAPRRSILSQSGFGSPAFSSAVSNISRLSAAAFVANPPPAPGPAVPKSKIPRMKSHMLAEGTDVPKPWKEGKNPRAVFSYWIVYIIILMGIAGGAVQCYFTWKNVQLDRHPLCLVLDEEFNDENSVFGPNGTFFREVNMDGFGNGEFEMTTESRNNSYVQDGMLYIVPTLTADNIGVNAVMDGTVYNITGCTFNITRPDNGFIIQKGQRVFDWDSYYRSCSAVSNATAGTVINPVQSARITTQKTASIKYGRVEIKAKMPNGDWMWPAIWMLPRDSVYGAWPLSGEIDIVESRGNGLRYTAHGSNYVQGSLNWGPAPQLNGFSNSYSWWEDRRKSFGSDFHTYVLEWTEDFLRISVDTRLHTLLDMKFNIPFFKRGDFPEVINNGSSLVALENPWINGTNATPFDQEFYLIMNVAVGSTNGWFPEAQGNKPWLDQAKNPPHDFAAAVSQWYPTWPSSVQDRAMIVDYVKMWTHC
ncbi:ectomycorrhiza-upregulated GH16 glucan endo-1,3-beta-glucosidase precursor [Gymnopilus junonius]|uniref:Ectomycorrhiza-upregulated GH16 glucan endo-1,3-beta-glucosidase n=1 Tax=Gymnopilus junonius TaxID=109634 RepID=A0A9P5NAV8_GYMJU|nr:ectomycorrhiza-upregulated GH16 glucan endo-1,3-beta-glucosidase precursor [Gymnopilus junonius]